MRIRLRPSLLALGLAFPILGHASLIRAQGGNSFELVWLAPSGCPLADEVRTEIDRLLGSPAHGPASGDLSVRAAVTRDSSWLVTLDTTLAGHVGHRTISAASCQGLANATALIVALMIDPDAVAAHSRAAETPPPALPPESLPPSPPPASPARTTLVLAGLGAAGSVGVLPTPDLGISASLGLVRPSWRVELRAAYSPRSASSEAVSNPAGGFGRFRLYTGALVGCLTLDRAAWELGSCLDVDAGAMHGDGIGAPGRSSKTSPWLAVAGGGMAAFKANHWLVFLMHLDVIVPVWRPRFVFDSPNANVEVFRSAAVGGRLTAGVELRF